MPNFADDEPPCVGLNPDTDPCPFCGAWLSDECGAGRIEREGGRPDTEGSA